MAETHKQRGRPKGVESTHVMIRMPNDLLAQIDAYAETLEAQIGLSDVSVSRAMAIRELCKKGLQSLTSVPQSAPVSHVNGQGAPVPQPTAQLAIPLALEPAPKTAHPVDVPQAAETPQPRKTPMIPTGMQQCPLGHALYPISQSECPTCGRERQRSQRTGSQQPEGEVTPVPGYEVRPRHSVVTDDVPAPEAPAEPVPEKAQDDHTGVQESARQTAIPPYDEIKYALGKLCPRGHDYHGTGQTLRRLPSHVCQACDTEAVRQRRKAQKQELDEMASGVRPVPRRS